MKLIQTNEPKSSHMATDIATDMATDIINKDTYIRKSSSLIDTSKKSTGEACTSNDKSISPKLVTGAYTIKKNRKYRIIILLSILFFSVFSTMLLRLNAYQHKDIQSGIAEDIIRFHVIANSDSNEDQTLKLEVKDTLVKWLSPVLRETASKEEAKALLIENQEAIKTLAETTIRNKGYAYSVTVSLEECYFPLKIYGSYTFPPGYYEALRVKIGKAEGKNWWCVMFPPLCFVDETYSIVDEDSGDQLKTLLSEEEYNTLLNKKTPIKVKFKLLEAIKDLFQ